MSPIGSAWLLIDFSAAVPRILPRTASVSLRRSAPSTNAATLVRPSWRRDSLAVTKRVLDLALGQKDGQGVPMVEGGRSEMEVLAEGAHCNYKVGLTVRSGATCERSTSSQSRAKQ